MQKPFPLKIYFLLFLCVFMGFNPSFAADSITTTAQSLSIDRIQLVSEQINLLKNRLSQAKRELQALQNKVSIPSQIFEKASKNLLRKAALDILVTKSALDSINMELGDSQQTNTWLEKNIQEIENELNVWNIFGLKISPNGDINAKVYRADLAYQQKLLQLEKIRISYLKNLQNVVNDIFLQKKAYHHQLEQLIKTRHTLQIKAQQMRDELALQRQQNQWLEQLNLLYSRLANINPSVAKEAYVAVERQIFYANEQASVAYLQSLIARYKDQIQQMHLAIGSNRSISLLNEIGNQAQILQKQIMRLEGILTTRTTSLEKHLRRLQKQKTDANLQAYLANLAEVDQRYKNTVQQLLAVRTNLTAFRKTLDVALQNELSARQGFPIFSFQTILNLGKELLLIPALSFQVVKSLFHNMIKAFSQSNTYFWSTFVLFEVLWLLTFLTLRKLIKSLLELKGDWHDKINAKWLSLQYFHNNFIDLMILTNVIGSFYLFRVPLQNYMFVIYLALVWLITKGLLIFLRLCLVETMHSAAGHDVRLYYRLRWVILVGGIITAMTVFIHQLPLIYELKTLFDHLFLLLLMIVSLLLLRSWDVAPSLVLAQLEDQHPYLQKSIRLIGILVPLLLLGNSIVGLLGYVNLVLTISWYEGIFLNVLIGYLILRGLLSDAMEQLSRMMIQHLNNGWLWTEAFLKPLDKVLRITLFLTAWAVLFLLYGWDKQSPIVERLTGLLHYQLANALNTNITPISIIELVIVISIFYWTAKWTREFVYRFLLSRTKDMGIRNSIAILSQYTIVIVGIFICLQVLGINLQALTMVAGMFAFGIGLGLRDLANNFVSGFLLLLERPIRVGDIVNISGYEGEVIHIGSRAVTIRTWDHMELMVPNAEIFNKSFTNWTARDNIIRSIVQIKISRYDNPHEVKRIIQDVLANHQEILRDPAPEVLLKDMGDTLLEIEFRYYVNIREVKSRVSVISAVLLDVWDAFAQHGIKAPYPQHEVLLRSEKLPRINLTEASKLQLDDH